VFGLLAGPLAGGLGYHKQFWRAAFVRRKRLGHVADPKAPDGEPVVGVAQRFERTVTAPVGRDAVLATALVVRAAGGGLLLRWIEAAPFWVVVGERKLLVTGACWFADAGERVELERRHDLTLRRIAAARAPRDAVVVQASLRPGDAIAVTGTVRDEQLPGHGGYRDSVVETLRGEPRSVVWVERVKST
jgi:hypothetical protein